MAGAFPLLKIYPLFVIKTTKAGYPRKTQRVLGLVSSFRGFKASWKDLSGAGSRPSRDPQGSVALPLTAGVLGATANHTEPGGLLRL